MVPARVLVTGVVWAVAVTGWHTVQLFRQVQHLTPGTATGASVPAGPEWWLPWLIIGPPVLLLVGWYLSRREGS